MNEPPTTIPSSCVHVLEEHEDRVNSVVLSTDGGRAVSAGDDGTVRVWDLSTGRAVAALVGHAGRVNSVALTADGGRAVSVGNDGTVRVWDLSTGRAVAVLNSRIRDLMGVALTGDGMRAVTGSNGGNVRVWDLTANRVTATLDGHSGWVRGVAVTADGGRAVSAGTDGTVRVWNLITGRAVAVIESFAGSLQDVALSADGGRAVSAGEDGTIRVWDMVAGQAIAVLEGHNGWVIGVAITANGVRAASAGDDGTVRVWDVVTGRAIAVLEGHAGSVLSVAFSEDGMRVASASQDGTVRVWDLTAVSKESYMNAKILLVGDTGVGKTGLSHRLTTRTKPGELLSTDAAWATQWTLPYEPNAEHGEREIWLWDFAGQPDYRLAHSLYMDETALAVFVFDPQDRNPLAGLAEWDRMMMRAAKRPFAKLLVAGRCDRGGLMISRDIIDQFRRDHGFQQYIETSANTGVGCEELRVAIARHIDWNAIPYTVSSDTFRNLKRYIVRIKIRNQSIPSGKEIPQAALLDSDDLAALVQKEWKHPTPFTDDEFRAVVGLLHGPCVVWKLEFGDLVLLQPERINAYAAALVRTVRKHINEDGVIHEADVLSGKLDYGDMVRLPADTEAIILRAMHLKVVDRGLCIRHHIPNSTPLLIFPSLYKRDRPERPTHPLILMTFRFAGDLDEIYATLVVRLHYTDVFESKQRWLDAADFESLTGEKLGFKMSRHEGRGEIVVFADANISEVSRLQFTKYVHEYLKAKDPTCVRIRHYVCPNPKCQRPFRDQDAVDEARCEGAKHVCCGRCGKKIILDDTIEQRFDAEEYARKAREMQVQSQTLLDNESKELIHVGHTYIIAGKANQIVKRYTNSDHGIDCEIEFRKGNGQASSEIIYLQLKSGDSYLSPRKDGSEVFRIKEPRWVEYWANRAYPVMLVVQTSDGRIRWMDVRAYIRNERAAGREIKQIPFSGELMTPATLLALRDRILKQK